jgi:GNAT superfamily N-acetyltransferase
MKIREIDPTSDAEIQLVAQRMRQTLVEVLGEEKGGSMYTMDWLIERVRWHLDPKNTDGRVYLSEGQNGEIIGHAIARIDHGSSFGYFSTVFVVPSSRRQGVATSLMKHVEDWFLKCGMPKIVYNTADNHVALIGLFKAHGYEITDSESEMVQLTKILRGA